MTPTRQPYNTRAAAASTPGGRGAVVGSAWRSALPTDLHFGLILALTIRGLAVTSYEEMRRVAVVAPRDVAATSWFSGWLSGCTR